MIHYDVMTSRFDFTTGFHCIALFFPYHSWSFSYYLSLFPSALHHTGPFRVASYQDYASRV